MSNTKARILARLVTARTQGKCVSRKELLKIGVSKGYIDSLLRRLLDEGLITRTGPKGRYCYQASEAGQAWLEKGKLPSTPIMASKASERPRVQTVIARPFDQYVDTSGIWLEAQKVSLQLDRYESVAVRDQCNPASPRDRAKQRSYSCKSFAIVVTKKGATQITLKSELGLGDLSEWLTRACKLSITSTNRLLESATGQLKHSFKRVEMPVFDRSLKRREVQFVVQTKVGDDMVESNINYSTAVDLEVLGESYLVDNWLAVLGATQHNQVVALKKLEQELEELGRKVEEQRKLMEQKARIETEQEDEDKDREVNYYV